MSTPVSELCSQAPGQGTGTIGLKQTQFRALNQRNTRRNVLWVCLHQHFHPSPLTSLLGGVPGPLSSALCEPDKNICCLKATKCITGSSALILTHLNHPPRYTEGRASRVNGYCLGMSGCGEQRSNAQSLRVSGSLTPALSPCE